MSDVLYKVTAPDGSPIHGGSGAWPLPTQGKRGWRVGRWRRVRGSLRACAVGLHLTSAQDVSAWMPKTSPFTIWEAEGRGDSVVGGLKIVYREARLLRPVVTIDEAQAALREKYEKDHRPLTSIADVLAFLKWTEQIPQPGKPIIFGVHRLPASDAISAAWPSGASWDRANFQRMIRRSRRILGIPESLDRACRAGDAGAIRLAASWPRASA